MKTRITLTLDSDLTEKIDEAKGDVSRSRFVERILEKTFSMWRQKEKAPGVEGYA